jgi:predicted unusual protein kinase regulating ubiquinone biosynthesis (AarF/ABC1/UbiB family)
MSDPGAQARIDTLLQIGLRLARTTASGRIALVKAAENIDPSWMPPRQQAQLGALLDQARAAKPEPITFAEVERVLKQAWGVRSVSDELDSLEREPVATTPLSQVHRAVHAGAPVAVKVLRPGLASAVRQDLMLAEALLAPAASAFPGFDPLPLLSEARERIMDELDLDNEAAMMRRFARGLRDGPVVAPRPVTALCRETVLVSSWLEGTSLAAAVAGGVGFEHDTTAAALLQFVIGGLREGLVHCDLDLADVLLLEDGRVGVVDYGAAASVDRERADEALAAVSAFAVGDGAGLDAALTALGVLEPGHGAAALSVAGSVLADLGGPDASRLDAGAVRALVLRLAEVDQATGLELLLAGRPVPGDLYPARGLGQLVSVLARIGASGIWREQVAAALERGWGS